VFTFVCSERFPQEVRAADNAKNPRVVVALQGIVRLVVTKRMDMREPFQLREMRKWEEKKRKLITGREVRDPATVAIGMWCMMRPTELCALRVRHVREYIRGVRIFLAESVEEVY
jgi:integrase